MATLAYYAHSHGSGHCRYADFVSNLIPGGIPVMTTHEYDFQFASRTVRLPGEDVADAVRDRYVIDVPPYLHYSPVGLTSIRKRALRILRTVEEYDIDLVIVDVSVEVAALLRASSVPYLYVKMLGHRNDLPHLAAYRGAMGLLAYYPAELEGPATPEWVRNKTTYLGFKPPAVPSSGNLPGRPRFPNMRPDQPLFCVVKGFGGGQEIDRAVDSLRQRFPGAYLVGVGPFGAATAGLLDHCPGVVTNVSAYLRPADVVIGACGSNLTAEVLQLGKPFVALPCTRPYDEQEAIAAALFDHGMAVSLRDFLRNGLRIATPPAARPDFGRERYADYFHRLTVASDWRDLRGYPSFISSPNVPEDVHPG